MLRLYVQTWYGHPMSERLFTAEEVADRLRLNKVTVQRWIRSGRLPAVNLGGTSGYRIRGADVEALLWTEYGGISAYLRRASNALYEAADAAKGYADRFGNAAMAMRSGELRSEAQRLLIEAEDFRDVQGFYRQPGPQGLRQLQPQMAAPHIYNAGDEAFQVVAVMVRDASADSLGSPIQSVKTWIAKAEASNPPDTEHGRLVRIAGPLLIEHLNNKA